MAVALAWSFIGCRQRPRLAPTVRPHGVPEDAVWAGGADGGAYIRCSVDKTHDYNVCTVWNDFTGESSGPAAYRLEPQGRPAAEQELSFLGAANATIYLKGGLTLTRVEEFKTPSS